MKEYIVAGIHSVEEALRKRIVKKIYFAPNKKGKNLQELLKQAQELKISLEQRELYQLDMEALGARHQGIIAVCQSQEALKSWQEVIQQNKNPLILILDSIQDPHNLGACLRSAAGAGVNAVLIPKDRAAEITPTVRKVASGAAESLAIFTVTNLRQEIEAMRKAGIWIIGAAGEAEKNLYQCDLNIPLAIILGNESEGLRHGLRESCDYLAKIPLAPEMESLNVSVACGIFLFEALRQRSAF